MGTFLIPKRNKNYLLMFIAGGTVYWINSTKLKRGSEGSNPRFVVVLITRIPIIGRITYRTQMIVIIITGLMLAILKPAVTSWSSINNRMIMICFISRHNKTKKSKIAHVRQVSCFLDIKRIIGLKLMNRYLVLGCLLI